MCARCVRNTTYSSALKAVECSFQDRGQIVFKRVASSVPVTSFDIMNVEGWKKASKHVNTEFDRCAPPLSFRMKLPLPDGGFGLSHFAVIQRIMPSHKVNACKQL